ncbi:putative baseplate assembly protein [Capilliphycus salinus ALCB114379]|uniref:putative baseplate assembly protein n=1 Tax=Capilliphycus salinus TaxID=2768948 RepID=UPI0039A68FDC
MVNFDFLPNLPKPNLDDRKFEDLVQECLLRIPRYCPEWTNHNPSDPGITMIELFSWLTDQMLYRFNQVPVRNYIVFLEMLGIRLQPPAAARTLITFELTKAQNIPFPIPAGTEVATERTETEEAIIFSTDRKLLIGIPRIKCFLKATEYDYNENLSNESLEAIFPRPRSFWSRQENGEWLTTIRTPIFEQSPQRGNCFYLVIEPKPTGEENSIEGNIIAITFKGQAATATGIDPKNPPREWEAWNGREWVSTLRQENDDRTDGFSFAEITQEGPNPEQGADVILHLPNRWPEDDLGTQYRGRWIRCIYRYLRDNDEQEYGYSSSPLIFGLSVRAIGGTVEATQCVWVGDELLGVSNGKAGQVFELQGKPVLQRQDNEYIEIQPPGDRKPRERWLEVPDFADSGANDPHYLIDSQTGVVQFGPLIREPTQLRLQTQARTRFQTQDRLQTQFTGTEASADALSPANVETEGKAQERQYGRVPPPGAEIYMKAYRTGGGTRGNVEAETLTVLRSAIPYVKGVINYEAATGGTEPESLEKAVLRVPGLLRSSQRAIIRDDFEYHAMRVPGADVARAHCLDANMEMGKRWTEPDAIKPGQVCILTIPKAEIQDVNRGLSPEELRLDDELTKKIKNYLDDRKPLGVQILLREPKYIGVKVEAVVLVGRDGDREYIRSQFLQLLYRFLNPITGGTGGQGWPLGHPVYPSDVVAYCQKFYQEIPHVRYLKSLELRGIRPQDRPNWIVAPIPEPVIYPGEFGVVCSWDNREENEERKTAHKIKFILDN